MTKELVEKWVSPLSNDPRIFSKYAENLGLDLTSARFYDVLGFVPQLYSMTPQPVYAVIYLYAVGEKGGPLDTRHKQPIPDDQIPAPQPWFSLQTVHNSCGALSILHAILNNLDHVKLKPDSWLANFAKETANLTPEQRARVIHNDDTLFSVHENAAKQNDDQTNVNAAKQDDGQTNEKATKQNDNQTNENATKQNDNQTNENATKQNDNQTNENATKQNDNQANENATKQNDGQTNEKATKQNDNKTNEKCTDHYITFISFGGKLWELDGKKPQPICHGETQDVLTDSIALIKEQFFPHLENPYYSCMLSLTKPLD